MGADGGRRDAFSAFHPAVNFAYFLAVLLFSMFFMYPACLAVSLLGAAVYLSVLKGPRRLLRAAAYALPLFLVTLLVSAAFNHRGATILAYLPNGNPLTLESAEYGAAAGVMLLAVLTWFSCYNEVMTSDKFVYLFGRVIPALSLVLSMTLRFIPKFRAQARAVGDARRCLGRAPESGAFRRMRNGGRTFSILVTWSLENAIETADSMRSRGYGLPGRTAFSIYRLERRDLTALAFIGCSAALTALCGALGAFRWTFYPVVTGADTPGLTAAGTAAYLLLCLLPPVIQLLEDRKWTRLQSAI